MYPSFGSLSNISNILYITCHYGKTPSLLANIICWLYHRRFGISNTETVTENAGGESLQGPRIEGFQPG